MVVNEELYKRFDAFIKKAFPLLKGYLDSGEKVRQSYDQEYKVQPGGYSESTVIRTDFFDFIYRHEKELKELAEFLAIQELIDQDATLSKHFGKLVGTGHGLMRRDLFEYLEYMLQRLVQEYHEHNTFDEGMFKKMYNDLETFIYKESISVASIVPLDNFKSEVDTMELGDKLVIRKITDEEKESFLHGAAFAGWPRHEIINWNFVIEIRHEMKKLFEGEQPTGGDPAIAKAIDNVLVTLRLFKHGNLGYNLVSLKNELEVPAFVGGTTGGFLFQRYIGNDYVLKKEEAEAFIQLYKSIPFDLISKEKAIDLAIRRLGFAYGRITHEDKVIDLMIAYEALFFRKGESGEQRHKLAVRAARLLGEKFDERKDLFREIKEFYDKRSVLVHASENTTPADLNKMEEYLRTSIKLFIGKIAEGKKHEDIIYELDLA